MKIKCKKSIMNLFLTGMVLFLGLFLSPFAARAYERADLLGPQAFVIRISDVPGFLTAIEQSPLGRLWNSKQMKPFLNNRSLAEAIKATLLSSLGEKKTNDKELSHLLWEELKMLKGELVVGISFGKGGAVSYTAAAAMEKADFLKGIEIEERMAELDEDMSSPRRQRFQGVDLFHTVEKKEGGSQPEWQAFYGGTMVSAASREWIERCIVRLKKELPLSPTGPPALHLRLTDRFIKSLIGNEIIPPPAEEDAGTEPPVSPSVVLSALGLDALEYISIDLSLEPKKMEFLFHVKQRKGNAITKTGPDGNRTGNRGLWALFCRDPLPTNHRLAYVPEDIYSYQVIRLDFNALWKEVPEILQAIDPRSVTQFQGFLGMFEGMYRINLSRDFFGNLGTLITSFSRMEGMMKQELHAWQVRNPMAMEKFLAKLFADGSPLRVQLQGLMEVHDLQGQKLYSFMIKPKRLDTRKPSDSQAAEPQFTYVSTSVVDGALVFGADKMVRSLIQAASSSDRQANAFYRSPLYTAMIDNAPEDAVGYAVTDISRLMKPLLIFSKDAILIERLKRESKPSPFTEFFDNLRFDQLPSVDFIASFFGKAVSYTQLKDGGFVMRTVIKYPTGK